jgi:hypothetical protein
MKHTTVQGRWSSSGSPAESISAQGEVQEVTMPLCGRGSWEDGPKWIEWSFFLPVCVVDGTKYKARKLQV